MNQPDQTPEPAALLLSEARRDAQLLEDLEGHLSACGENFHRWPQKDTKEIFAELHAKVASRLTHVNAAIAEATAGAGTPGFTVISVDGNLTVDADGYVNDCVTNNHEYGCGEALYQVTRVDLAEWRRHGTNHGNGDIYFEDIGHWSWDFQSESEEYLPASTQWRAEMAGGRRRRPVRPAEPHR